jgi:hypothetical protein
MHTCIGLTINMKLSGVYDIKWCIILIEPQSPLLIHIIYVGLRLCCSFNDGLV